MALFDKLKGLADKAKETAKDVAGVTKGIASSVAKDLGNMGNSQEAREARAEAAAVRVRETENEKEALFSYLVENHADGSDEYMAKYERYLKVATDEEVTELDLAIEERKQKDGINLVMEYIESIQSACDVDKGDCGWLEEHFYCTCGEDTECPRKKYIKVKQVDTLFSDAHLPYIKALGSFKKEQGLLDESEWRYRNLDVEFEASDVLRAFFAAFLPEYDQSLLGGDAVLEYFYENGLGRNNDVLGILFAYKEKTGGKALPWFLTILELEGVDLRQDFFKNPSLYARNYKDFTYTVRILDIVSNPDKLNAYFKDTSNISVEQLYNPDGTIKEAGIGGVKEGFYGDVIYNIVESWSGEED